MNGPQFFKKREKVGKNAKFLKKSNSFFHFLDSNALDFSDEA